MSKVRKNFILFPQPVELCRFVSSVGVEQIKALQKIDLYLPPATEQADMMLKYQNPLKLSILKDTHEEV